MSLFLADDLSQHDLVAMPDISQRVSMSAAGADEVAPLVIDRGLHGSEHDFQLTAFALPHGRIPLGGRSRIARLAAIEAEGKANG